MKRMLKTSLVLCIMLLIVSGSVFATSEVNLKQNQELLQMRDNLIIEAIRKGEDDLHSILKESNEFENLKFTPVKELKVIKKQRVKDTDVYFYNDGTFVIDELIEVSNSENSTYTPMRNGVRYKSGSNSVRYNGYLGNKLFEVILEADFAYDGNKAWGDGRPNGYYERGVLSSWKVENWDCYSETRQGGSYASAYAQGNFYFGISYEGMLPVIQERFVKIGVSCNSSGSISRH